MRLAGGASCADGAKGASPFGIPSSAAAGNGTDITLSAYCFVPPKGRRDEETAESNFSERKFNTETHCF